MSFIVVGKKEELQQRYNKIMENVLMVKNLSGGKYDLTKSGYLPQNEALKSIHYNIQSLDGGEPINAQEEHWISSGFKGGIRFIKEDITLEKAYEYDIRGSYASVLASDKFTFPLKEGVFKKIDKLPTEFLPYGFYRVKIEESEDWDLNKLFKFNERHIYTHFDINSAKLLKLKMELIIDDEANALLYQSGRGCGSVYFGGLVNDLNKLKMKVAGEDKDNSVVKEIMASLWGVLCSRKKHYVAINKPINLKGNFNILSITDKVVAFNEVGKLFKYNFGRLGAFLTASARHKMVKDILPVKEFVYRVYTDSILSSIPLEGKINIGEKLGEYKEGKHNGKGVEVFKNGRRPVWDE